jgi:hypothetical protein
VDFTPRRVVNAPGCHGIFRGDQVRRIHWVESLGPLWVALCEHLKAVVLLGRGRQDVNDQWVSDYTKLYIISISIEFLISNIVGNSKLCCKVENQKYMFDYEKQVVVFNHEHNARARSVENRGDPGSTVPQYFTVRYGTVRSWKAMVKKIVPHYHLSGFFFNYYFLPCLQIFYLKIILLLTIYNLTWVRLIQLWNFSSFSVFQERRERKRVREIGKVSLVRYIKFSLFNFVLFPYGTVK